MKLYKLSLILFICLLSNQSYAQLVVSNPSSDFADALRWAEEKVYLANEKAQSAQLLLQIKQQLEEMKRIKESTEKYYNLAEKIQEDLRKLGAVADGGLPAFVNACEIILQESLNPADYVPNVNSPISKKFRKMVRYDASGELSSDTRDIHKELFTFRENDLKMQELSLTSHMAEFAGLSHNWRSYHRDLDAMAAEKTKQLSIQMKKAAELMMEQIQKEGALSLTEAERMDMLIKAVDMYRQSSLLELEYAERVQKMLDESGPSEADLVDYVETGIAIKLDYTLKNVVQPYSKNSGFSLVGFDKKTGNIANLKRR